MHAHKHEHRGCQLKTICSLIRLLTVLVDTPRGEAAWRQEPRGHAPRRACMSTTWCDIHTMGLTKKRSFTGHSFRFLQGHSGSFEVIRCHSGHSLACGLIKYKQRERAHVQRTYKETHTDSMTQRKNNTKYTPPRGSVKSRRSDQNIILKGNDMLRF